MILVLVLFVRVVVGAFFVTASFRNRYASFLFCKLVWIMVGAIFVTASFRNRFRAIHHQATTEVADFTGGARFDGVFAIRVI
jgi:hypothetical protein